MLKHYTVFNICYKKYYFVKSHAPLFFFHHLDRTWPSVRNETTVISLILIRLWYSLVFQSAMLDLYIKSVLMSKTKPQQHILEKSGSLLRHVSHSEFKDLLLPTVQKTMLRSPENAMQSERI